MGDANPELSHHRKKKRLKPEIRQYVAFTLGVIFSIAFFVISIEALYLMGTNPPQYQERIRQFFETLRKSNPVLPLIPPNLTPLVTGASALSFAIVSSIYSALVLWIIVLVVAGWCFGIAVLRFRRQRKSTLSIQE